MLKLDYDQLVELSETQLCAEHKSPVIVAWVAEGNHYSLRCKENHYPDALIKITTISQDERRVVHTPGPELNQQNSSNMAHLASSAAAAGAPRMGISPPSDLGTGQLLLPQAVELLLEYARRSGLDFWMGHVVMMYGNPYPTFDGLMYHAAKAKRPFSLESQPFSEEQYRAYKVDESSHAWLARVIFPDTKTSVTGLGIVTADEMTEESKKSPGRLRSPVVAKHPQLQAQKRAEWQAMKRAFPLGETEPQKEEVDHANP